MFGLRWMTAAGLALATLVAAPSAHAQLYGLTHDRATGAAQLAQIDAASGALTPVGGGLIGCCEIGAAAIANDPFGQDLYAVGPDPLSASRALRLLRFALPTGTATAVGLLGTSDRVVGLGFERSTQRLIALLAPASGPLRLVSVNTSTGAATTIHSGSVDCCVLEPGLAALAGGNFLLVGRLRTDAAGTRKLFAYSTSGSNAVTVTALAAGTALVALVTDPQTGSVYGLQQSFSAPPRVPSLQLVQVQPGSGISPIGAAVSACCAISLDTAAIEGGALRVVARDPADASGLSLLSFNLNTGVSSFSSGVLPSARIVDGLITVGPATQLAFGQQPMQATGGATLTPAPTVRLLDAGGNLTSSTANVTLAIGSNPAGGSLSGTLTRAAIGGVATFNDLSINTAGNGYTLTAASSGVSGATSGTFNITAGAPTQLSFLQQPSNTHRSESISPAITVRTLDEVGNPADYTGNITLAIGNNPGGGTLSGTTAVAAIAGVATFNDLSINRAGSGYTLVASSSGLSGATSTAFNVFGPLARLAFAQQPTSASSGATLTPAPTVHLLDAGGNLTDSTENVTLAIGNNPAGGTLSGTATVAAVAGVATFTGLSINTVGNGYTLVASISGVMNVTSNAFSIVHNPYLVRDINLGGGNSWPSNLTEVNGTLFFQADDGTSGEELWKSDGSAAGTVMVKDINPSDSSSPYNLTDVNGTLFFLADDGTNGVELWKSNGTEVGTVLVKDIWPGNIDSNTDNLTNVNGTLFFKADDGTNGAELWTSNGTEAGTVMVKDIRPGNFDSAPDYLTNVNGTLFFTASDGTNGAELWKSDGSAAGTVMVKNINPGGADSNAYDLTNVNGTLFFEANDGTNGNALWKSDGTQAGTVMVKNIDPDDLTNVNGTLFFRAYDATNGAELWKSDGTTAGTVLVKDIRSGNSDSSPSNLTNVNGTLFFGANDGTHSFELWKSDGSEAGTVLVKDIWLGNFGSGVGNLTNVNGTLFFTAVNSPNNEQVWRSDGTDAGTVAIGNINPAGSDQPSALTGVNGTLFFRANDGTTGFELWAIEAPNDPPTISDVANQSTSEDTATTAIAFTVGDLETAPASLAVSGSSSNTTLVPNANIVFGGSGANRTVTITPAANRSGTSTITLTVTDETSASATDTFVLTVNPVNDPPSFVAGSSQTLPAGTNGAQTIVGWATAISDGDPDFTQALSFNSSNNNNALFTTQPAVASNGTLTFTPTGVAGSATVSVSMSDDTTAGGAAITTAVQTFSISVNASSATTTTITAIAPPVSQTVGVPYTVSVSVTGGSGPTGLVTVGDGGVNTCSITLPGTNCALTSTTVGAKTITANYAGDSNNPSSSGTAAYSITASPGNPGGLQVGTVTLPPTVAPPGINAPSTVTFAQAFNAIPVIIVQPSDEDEDPQAVRIRNVTTTGFELLQVEAPGCNGCTGAGGTMTVHWLAAMPGSYRLTQDTNAAPAWALTPTRGSGAGALLKVGVITTTATQYDNVVGNFSAWPLASWDSVSWPVLGNGLDFVGAPVVLTSIQSWNNEGANLSGAGLIGTSQPWATSVASNVGASGFQVAIEASGISDDDLAPPGFSVGERIGYVAIEGDISQLLLPIGGPPYVGLVTGTAPVNLDCSSSDHLFPAATPIDAANFKAFAGKQTRNAAGGWLRRCLLSNPSGTTVSVGMFVQLEGFAGVRLGLPDDTAGVTAFSGSFLTTPVTLAKMGVDRSGDSLRVRWSTTHEVGQVGFRLWGRSGADGDWQLLTPNLIASAAEETRQARSYEHTVAAAGSIREVRIEDVDVVGASRFHPAVTVGSSRGEDSVDAPIDWSAIRASNTQTPATRASTSTVATALAEVSSDGVQRVAVADLIARDSRFNGQPAASLAVLDGTAPIPRHVGCAVLQAGCTIEFLGVARESRYGADNAYTMTLDANAARPVNSGHAQTGSGSARIYTDSVVYYPNRAFNSSAPAGDPWLDERLVASSGAAQLNRTFTLPERVPGPVQLTVDVWGGLDFPDLPPDHHVQILVNGQVLTDRRFDSFVAERIDVAVPESLLTASNTLTLRLPRDPGFSVDIVMLDGFKVSYPRRTRVTNGTLVQGSIDPTAVSIGIGEFRDGFEAAAPAAASFQIDGQVNGAVLWSLIGGELRRDELTAASVLLPITSSAWRVADPTAIRTPTLALPADPYVLPAQVDYVVITHPLFESGLAPLLALQASRGLSTAVLRTDAIYAAHSDHARDPQAIKTAIAAAKQRGARFVLLVGGDSIDYHNYLGSGSQSYLPTWYTQSSRYIFHAATDHPYADLSGDLRPELAIGRLPVRTTTELTRAITSITARGNSVAQRYLAVAGASQPGERFGPHSRAILGYLRQPGQLRDYALADEIGTAAAKARARDGLGGTADWVNYLGHSSAHRWAFDNLLDVSQLASITRSGVPAIVSQWSCWNNDFTAPTQDTMAHALMLRSNGLAAAVIGATSLAEDASHLALGTRFFDVVEDGRLGDYGGLPITTMGEALKAAKADLLLREPAHRSAAYTIVLFGDPAAPLQ